MTFVIEPDEAARLIDISKELENALSTTVRINHNQVMDIVVADLLAKYKSAKSRGLGGNASMLSGVLLQYYLTPDELEALLAA